METFDHRFELEERHNSDDLAQTKKLHHSQVEQIHLLEQKVNQLELVCEALWQIVRQAEHLEDNFLETVMNDVLTQVKQKKEDTKVKCPQCKLEIPITRDKCFYCGEALNTL